MKQYATLLVMVFLVVTAGHIVLLRLLLSATRGVPFYLGLLSLGIVCVGVLAVSVVVLLRSSISRRGDAAPGNEGARPLTDIPRTLERLVSATILAASVNLCFFVVVPVTLDRSVSTFLLARLPGLDAPRGMTKEEMEALFREVYVVEYDAVGRRLEEQRASGNVVEASPGEFRRTASAEAFLAFGRLVVGLYGLQSRFVESD